MMKYTEEELLLHKLSYDSYPEYKKDYFDYVFAQIDYQNNFNCLITPFDFYGKSEIYKLSFYDLRFEIKYYNFKNPIEHVYYSDSNYKERKLKINYKPNEEKLIKKYDQTYLIYNDNNEFEYIFTDSSYNYMFDNLEDLKKLMNYLLDRRINDIKIKTNS